MTNKFIKLLIKPLLILAIATPAFASVNVGNAEAGSRDKRAAIIAGAIIGGVIGYHATKRNRRYHRGHHYNNRVYYAPRYSRRHNYRRAHRGHGHHYAYRRGHSHNGYHFTNRVFMGR